MKNVQVSLSVAEMYSACGLAMMRQIRALVDGKSDQHGAGKRDPWEVHVEGACGEMAFAKAIGRYFEPTLNTYKTVGDGVCGIEVRTRRESWHDLNIRATDRLDAPWVLVTGRAPSFIVRGWIYGSDAKRDEWWHDPSGDGFAWWVPQEDLRSLGELDQYLAVPARMSAQKETA